MINVFNNSKKLYDEIIFCTKQAQNAKQSVVWSKRDKSVSWCKNVRDDDVVLWDANEKIDDLGIYTNDPDIMIMASTIYQFDPEGFNNYLAK